MFSKRTIFTKDLSSKLFHYYHLFQKKVGVKAVKYLLSLKRNIYHTKDTDISFKYYPSKIKYFLI